MGVLAGDQGLEEVQPAGILPHGTAEHVSCRTMKSIEWCSDPSMAAVGAKRLYCAICKHVERGGP